MAKEKKKIEDEKHFIEVKKDYTAGEFESAMTKLHTAACKFEKGAPGAVALTAFEAVKMPPHVLKEQLKLVFGIKVLN